MFNDIISACIIMYKMIIDDEFDTYESIVDLNIMFILKVDMIVGKIEQFHDSLLAINKLKIKKLIMHLEMH